ncbi:radical SAM protein [bacterium]|nr:radical SAM protein [bacterium]
MDWREFLCVSVEITDFCNGGCIFCDHHYGNFIHGRRALFMKYSLVQKLFGELDSLEVLPSVISLSWLGESLLHPQINEILESINKLENLDNFHLNTNGMNLDREKIDIILANEKIRRIRISIDAATKNTYCKIKSVDRFDFDLLIENIRYLMEKRGSKSYPQLVFSFVICEENEQEAEDFMKFWINEINKYDRHYMVTHDFYIPEETSRCDVVDYYMLLAPDQSAATELYRKVIERIGVYKYKDRMDEKVNQSSIVQDRFMKEVSEDLTRRPCASLWRMANVHSSGLLTVCCHDLYLDEVVGDINDNTFGELWYGEKIETIRKEHLRGIFKGLCKKCGNIEYFSVSDSVLTQYIDACSDEGLKKEYFDRMGIESEKDYDQGHN